MLSVYQEEYLTGLWGRQEQGGYNPGKIALCMSSWAFSFFSGHFHFILQYATYISFQIFFLNLFTDLDGSMMAPARPYLLRAFDLIVEVQEQGRNAGTQDCQPESCFDNSSRYLLSNL